MYYTSDDVNNIKMEVGDLVVGKGANWDNTDRVEVVTHVGLEGIVLYLLGGGVRGEMERYTTVRSLVSTWHMFAHKGSEEHFDTLNNLKADREA